MGQIIASLRLIPVILERRTHQIHVMLFPTLDEVGRINIARIHQVVLGQHGPFGFALMDGSKRLPIGAGRMGRLDMGNELRDLLVTGLGEVDWCHPPRTWRVSRLYAHPDRRES